jgi:hypothetical protein
MESPMLFVSMWIYKLLDHPMLRWIANRVSPSTLRLLRFAFPPSHGWVKQPTQGTKEEYRNLLEQRIGCKFQILTVQVNDQDKTGLATVQAMLEQSTLKGWHLAGAYYHCGEYVCILTEQPTNQESFWTSLGIRFSIKNEAKLAQLGKRLKRVLAHHRHMVFGLSTLIQSDSYGDTWEFRSGYGMYTVRVIKEKSFTTIADGEGFISPALAALASGVERLPIGARLSMTGVFPFGGIKHHFITSTKDTLGNYDMVVLDPKAEIYCDPEYAFLGTLELCHGRDQANLNIQQVLNFGMTAKHEGQRFVSKVAIDWMNQLRAEARQPGFLQKQLEKLNQSENPRLNSLKGTLAELSDPKLGFDLVGHPTLYKSLISTMLGQLVQVGKMRIPSAGHAMGRYVSFDYSSVVHGKYYPALSHLQPGECFISGLEFPEGVTSRKVAITRDPSGDGTEYVILTAVTSPELVEAFGNKGITIVINNHDLIPTLALLGGADQDDCLTVYYSDYAVSFFETVVSKLAASIDHVAAPAGEPVGSAMAPIPLVMTPETAYLLAIKMHGLEGIGQVVNPLMAFNYMRSIEPWLRKQGHKIHLASGYMNWIAPKLSDVIDGSSKTGDRVFGLANSLSGFSEDISHMSSSLVARMGGEGWLYSRRKSKNQVCVLKDTPLELAQSDIQAMIEETKKDLQVQKGFRHGLAYVMTYVPADAKKCYGIAAKMHTAFTQTLDKAADTLLDKLGWAELAALRSNREAAAEVRSAANAVAYGIATKMAFDILSQSDLTEDQKSDVVMVYYQIVHGKWMKNGKQFSDSLLWGKELTSYTIRGIKRAYEASLVTPPVPPPAPAPAQEEENSEDGYSERERREDYLLFCQRNSIQPSNEGFARFIPTW